MSYFYSEQMTYCQGLMAIEIGWDVMNQFGKLDCVHFQQKTLDYNNPFIKNLQRCDQNIYKINEIKNFIDHIKEHFMLNEMNSLNSLFNAYQSEAKLKQMEKHLYMNVVEEQIDSIHKYFVTQKSEIQSQDKQLYEKLMMFAILITLRHSQEFSLALKTFRNERILDSQYFLANRRDLLLIEKGLFRISRGNAMVRHIDLALEAINRIFSKEFQNLQEKVVCMVMYEKGQTNILSFKIHRFLSCLDVTHLDVNLEEWEIILQRQESKIKQIQGIQKMTNDSIEQYLHQIYESKGVSGSSYLSFLQSYVQKEKEIYRQLSCFKLSTNFIHFHCYVPTKMLPISINPNQKLPPLTLIPKQKEGSPPTKFDTLPILQIPQQIVNTYGVPTYGEFNPAVLYIVTFSFFIGVMFGDVGHMLMVIPIVIYFKLNIWVWTIVFFMGYCGFIYNQFFGLNLGIFTSCYEYHPSNGTTFVKGAIIEDCVYAFGIDEAWKPAENKMQFVNSLKMKIAVIIGVIHMMLGLMVRVINCIKKKQFSQLITIAIPQILFLLCTFVYMDILIFIKWNTSYVGNKTAEAPSIIATMISVYAEFGGDPDDPVLWSNQRVIERLVLIVAIVMIPIMLIGYPLVKYCQNKKSEQSSGVKYQANNIELQDIQQRVVEDMNMESELRMESEMKFSNILSSQNQNNKQPLKEQQLKQIMVHQFIETIQYVLGTVSNTASYLRLWALSLAHGQLAEVIFDLILVGSLSGGYSGIAGMFFTFPIFYVVTFGVLLCMDIMQCFLHSLRLHWVEFQNKFYEGRGYKFEPFSFKKVLNKQN